MCDELELVHQHGRLLDAELFRRFEYAAQLDQDHATQVWSRGLDEAVDALHLRYQPVYAQYLRAVAAYAQVTFRAPARPQHRSAH